MLRQYERTALRRASRATSAMPDSEQDFSTYVQSQTQEDEQTNSMMPKRTPWHMAITHWYTRSVTMLEGAWARFLLLAALALATVLLYVLPGGFPPWAWRFLARVIPQFSTLLASQGLSAVFALIGLVLLSFSLFVLWVITLYCWVLLIYACWLAYYRWYQRRQQQRRAEVFAGVQMSRLYEMGIQQQEQEAIEQEQQWEREVLEQTAQLRAQASGVIRGGRTSVDDIGVESITDASDEGTSLEEEEISYTYTTTPGLTAMQTEDADYGSPQPMPEKPNQITTYAVSSGSDPGKVRKKAPNEDTVLAIQGTCETLSGPQPVGIFIVADGMGGHADGQAASRLAVQEMGDVLIPLLMNKTQETELFLESLKDAVHRANLAIYTRNREREHMMGTTLTAALVVGSTAHIVNAGDSRTYVYHAKGELEQVTRDHSSVARLVEAGAIEPDDIYVHPLRNQIYRCLGEHASLQVDSFEISLEVGDTLLLCSDGLWEMVRDPHIATILKQTHMHPAMARDELIQAALDGGGADNVSVLVATML